MTGESVWNALRPEDRELLAALTRACPNATLALVGGGVRDALLGLTPLDLDVVTEARVLDLANTTGLRFTYHPQFDNATLHLPDGRFLDLIRARGETYPAPGAPPVPYPADLLTDLARRDFSVNAMALNLHAHTLIDPHDGQDHLVRKVLHPLHARSFEEDPSRLGRAARLAVRLAFDLSAEGAQQIPDALRHAPHTPRLRGELNLTFHEPRPGAVLARLRQWHATGLYGRDGSEPLLRLDAQRAQGVNVPPVVYAAAWLHMQERAIDAAQAFQLGEKPLRLLQRALSDAPFAPFAPESVLRRALALPEPTRGLSGADVMALGVPPGPPVGRALAYLANLRRSGLVRSVDDERAALKAYLEGSTAEQ